MKSITLYLALLATAFLTKTFAQESFTEKMNANAQKMELAITEEQNALKNQLEALNNQVSFGTITAAEADAKKKQLSQESADRLDKKLAEIDAERNALIQAKVNGTLSEAGTDAKKTKTFEFTFKNNDSIKRAKGESRTTSQFVFAIGLNNVVTNGTVARSDFRVYKSRFYEWGIAWNYRLAKDSQLLHLKYGLSLMYNDLRPTDNRFFVDNGETTDLVTSPVRQDDSRFRNVNLVVPMHIEFDFSPTEEKDGKKVFRSHESVRIGLGGYTGINVGSKLVQKYDENDYRTRVTTRGDWNTNTFIYGLSAYAGYGQIALYMKYDLNPLFKDNAVAQRNVSAGIRFDFN